MDKRFISTEDGGQDEQEVEGGEERKVRKLMIDEIKREILIVVCGVRRTLSS